MGKDGTTAGTFRIVFSVEEQPNQSRGMTNAGTLTIEAGRIVVTGKSTSAAMTGAVIGGALPALVTVHGQEGFFVASLLRMTGIHGLCHSERSEESLLARCRSRERLPALIGGLVSMAGKTATYTVPTEGRQARTDKSHAVCSIQLEDGRWLIFTTPLRRDARQFRETMSGLLGPDIPVIHMGEMGGGQKKTMKVCLIVMAVFTVFTIFCFIMAAVSKR